MTILSQKGRGGLKGGDGFMRESLREYCGRMGDETLLKQWNRARNGPVTPETVSYGSNKRVWWQCDAGHEWQAMVKSRTVGCGCPYCANRLLVRGKNDLATVYPELATEWHPERNGPLTPADVMCGSRKRVWWQCKAGHEWQATVNARAEGRACPACDGKQVIPGENDLASQFPTIAAEWHPTRNGRLRPREVTPYSNRRVWWRCEQGHTYRAPISHRTAREDGCPYCAGRRVMAGFNDLATLEPEIAAEWHPELNAPLTAEDVTCGSRRKIWWQCREGHIWRAVVYSRTGSKRCGCPICAGRVKGQRRRYAANEQSAARV